MDSELKTRLCIINLKKVFKLLTIIIIFIAFIISNLNIF